MHPKRIMRGPDIIRFVISLMLPEITALFHIEDSIDLELHISTIEREDGSGNKFLFKGTTTDNRLVEGSYNTENREGHLLLTRPTDRLKPSVLPHTGSSHLISLIFYNIRKGIKPLLFQ